jgi:hypothetical protein
MRKLILGLILLAGCPSLEQSGLFARRRTACRGAGRVDCPECERGRIECGQCTTVFGCKYCRFSTKAPCVRCQGTGSPVCEPCAGSGSLRVQRERGW